MAKKILAVIRVSTERQETESQKKELVNFILSLGKYQEEEIEFIEVAGASAVKMNEKYLQMLKSIKDKITESDSIRSVAFWHLNRLGRNEKAIVDMKVWFIENHIQVYVKNPSLTLLDNEGNVDNGANIAWGVFAAMVAYDTKEIKEKTIRGRRRNADIGKVQSGNALFGYIKDKDGHIVIDEGGSADVVRLIFNKYAEGQSTLSIYKELSEKGMMEKKIDDFIGKRVINNILSNESYCGRVRNGKIVSEGKNRGKEYNKTTTKYPPIISEETFDKVAEIRKSRQHEKQETNNVYFAKSLIKYSNGNITETLAPARATATYRGTRTQISIAMNVIDTILWNEASHAKLISIATQSIEHKEELERHLSDCELKMKTAKQVIAEKEKSLDKLNDLYINGNKLTKELYEKKYNEILSKLNGEKARLEQVRRQRVSLVAQLEHIAKDEHIADMSDVECISATDSEKAQIVREMVSKVEITRNGDDRIITLYDKEGVEYVNSYIYTKVGSRAFLSIKRNGTIHPLNLREFVVKRFERKKYSA